MGTRTPRAVAARHAGLRRLLRHDPRPRHRVPAVGRARPVAHRGLDCRRLRAHRLRPRRSDVRRRGPHPRGGDRGGRRRAARARAACGARRRGGRDCARIAGRRRLPLGRLRAVLQLPRRQAGEQRCDYAHRDVSAAHAARVHRVADLATSSDRRRGLRGVEGLRHLRARAAGGARPLPARGAEVFSEPDAHLRRAGRLRPGARRSRHRRPALAARVVRRRHRARALDRVARAAGRRLRGAPRRRLARPLARALRRAGHHRRHPTRRRHVARLRRRRHPTESVAGPMAKVLVTGGAGFIGSNVVRGLIERGDSVRVLDNFSTGNRVNLEGLDVEIVEGELRSYERVHNAVRGTEVVYHLGALGSVPRSVQDPLTSSAVNVEGTLNVLLAARDEGVRRVVFASSSSVYGAKRELPVGESLLADPISPYGVAKLAAERYCVSFSRVYDSFETVVLRYFNVFGPRQSPFSQYAAMVPLFITAIAAGKPVTVYGDGEQSRDFTYVANVVDATIRAGEADGVTGEIFNVAGGSPTSVNRIAETIGEILGKPVERRHLPSRAGDIRNSWADLSKSERVLGYVPLVDLANGLLMTVEFLL